MWVCMFWCMYGSSAPSVCAAVRVWVYVGGWQLHVQGTCVHSSRFCVYGYCAEPFCMHQQSGLLSLLMQAKALHSIHTQSVRVQLSRLQCQLQTHTCTATLTHMLPSTCALCAYMHRHTFSHAAYACNYYWAFARVVHAQPSCCTLQAAVQPQLLLTLL